MNAPPLRTEEQVFRLPAAQELLDAHREIERLRTMLDERNERLLLLYEALTGQHRSTWPAAVGSGT